MKLKNTKFDDKGEYIVVDKDLEGREYKVYVFRLPQESAP